MNPDKSRTAKGSFLNSGTSEGKTVDTMNNLGAIAEDNELSK